MKDKIFLTLLTAVSIFVIFPIPDSESGWAKHSQNPIASFYNDIPGLKVFSDPSVLVEDGSYTMWFSCNNGEVSQICYATSGDGLKWKAHTEPVLKLGIPGAWDDYNSEVPTVMKDGNLYKMWYAGYSRAEPDTYHIGYATSPDGIRWTRLPAKDSPHGKEGLVLMYDNSREGEINTIADPAVVKVNGTYHLWYNGFGTKMLAISHATSKDGIHWERDAKNPVLTPSTPWEMVGDEGSVTQPHVLWDGTQFEIWYGSFADEFQRYTAISHATSRDGTVWVKDDASVLQPGPEELWPSVSVIRVGNEARLYYIGFPKLGEPAQLYLATRRIASVVPKVVSKSDRVLSIAITAAEDNDYEQALAVAKSAGATEISVGLHWKQLEPSMGGYDTNAVSIFEFFASREIPVHLGAWPFDNLVKVVPDDLEKIAFDNPEMIQRYKNMIDWLFENVSNVHIASFNVGSEFDQYFKDHPTEWKQFQTFYRAVAGHIRTKRPGLKVTAEATFIGLTRDAKAALQSLHQSSDFVGVSYYPLDDDFMVKDPTVVQDDFKTIVTLYPGKIIHFTQLGYPSSSTLLSSEARQAEFIRQAFRAWDAHSTQVKRLEFTWLHDISPTLVEGFALFYCVGQPQCAGSENLTAFFASLGLRTCAGKDKEGFRALKAEAKARGW